MLYRSDTRGLAVYVVWTRTGVEVRVMTRFIRSNTKIVYIEFVLFLIQFRGADSNGNVGFFVIIKLF